MADTKKFLDYAGLQSYDSAIKNYISDALGTGYNVAGDGVNVKRYIDSRIYVGTQAEIDVALAAKKIDNTTFTVIIDEDAEGIASITAGEITNLFSAK